MLKENLSQYIIEMLKVAIDAENTTYCCSMKNYAEIIISDVITGQTPVHFGANVEMQDNCSSTNLWDWIADSGMTVVRSFHPEQTLRTAQASAGRWGRIESKNDFDQLREKLVSAPQSESLCLQKYMFNRHVPWIGIPDEFTAYYRKLNVEVIYSLGYGTAHFPRPLIHDINAESIPEDEGIDWEAAFSAYEYYFAVIHHFAFHSGGRLFLMLNEPENRKGWFHLPADLAEASWSDLFWKEDAELNQRYRRILAVQYAVLCRLARLAMRDVQQLLDADKRQNKLLLAGPASVLWPDLWSYAKEYLDILDIHHYHNNAETFHQLLSAARTAAGHDKCIALSEFNNQSGGMCIQKFLFNHEAAANAANLLMTIIADTPEKAPAMQFAAFYLFGFPSTHRNYKHLLYGDMNLLDWSGSDKPLWSRGTNRQAAADGTWYPSASEQQLRFTTPAYYHFRMLARACRGNDAQTGKFPLLNYGIVNPSSSGPEDLPASLKVSVVQQPKRMFVNILNMNTTPAQNILIKQPAGSQFGFAAIRESSSSNHDALIGIVDTSVQPVSVTIPPMAMVQVIFMELKPDTIRTLTIKEESLTPGSLTNGLELWQTTRLLAIATLPEGEINISDLAVIWKSEHPDEVKIEQTGLLQRLRKSEKPTLISAEFPGGKKATCILSA